MNNEHEKNPVENTEEVAEVVENNEEATKNEETVDYDNELNLRKNQREHNRKGYEMRKEAKNNDDDEESIEEKMRRVIREEREALEVKSVQNYISNELNKIENESERKLVADYYENTIKQSGTSKEAISNDISLARILANRPRIQKENEEMKVAIKNRSGISNDGSGSNQDKQTSNTSKWSKEQLADFKKRGITPEQVEATMEKIKMR